MMRVEKNPNLRFDVHFTTNCYPFYIMHEAIDLLVEKDMFHVVFPPDLSFPPLRIKKEDIE
jgi:hypothetical protein